MARLLLAAQQHVASGQSHPSLEARQNGHPFGQTVVGGPKNTKTMIIKNQDGP
jgi:hypothetical protein